MEDTVSVRSRGVRGGATQPVRASGSRRAALLALDGLSVLALTAAITAVGWLCGFRGMGLVLPAAVGLVIATAWLAIAQVRTGATPAAAVLGLRRVDQQGQPALLHAAAYDLRTGRDPLMLAPTSSGPLASVPAPWQQLAARQDGVGLLADDQTWLPVARPTVIGRVPQALSDGVERALLGFTDVSRSMSKSHALLEPVAGPGEAGADVTDLASTNGSRIIGAHGRTIALIPGERARLSLGETLELGDRRFVLGTKPRRASQGMGTA